MGEDQSGIFHPYWPEDQWGATPMATLVTGGVGEGNLGMVATFCCHDQVKMEASDALSTLCQCDLLELSMVVVWRYTNTPIFLEGLPISSIWMWALSWGTSSAQFPHLCRLLPFSGTEMLLPCEEGEVGLKVCPLFWEVLWKSSEEEHCLSDPVSWLISLSALHV